MATKTENNHSYDDSKYAGLISEIQLPGQAKPYQLHDPDALHDVSDLGLDKAVVFGGVVAKVSDLPALTNVSVGTVYFVKEDASERICVEVDGKKKWEEFGSGFINDHVHDVSVSGSATLSGSNTLSGSASVTGTNSSSEVTGSASVAGANQASAVTASGSIEVPQYLVTEKYIQIANDADTFVQSVTPTTSSLVTTTITPAGSAASVVESVTPSTASIAGVSGSTTASKATASTAVNIAKVGTAVNVPNISVTSATVVSEVTPSTSSFSNMSATVTGNCLVFSSANVNYVSNVSHTDTTVGSASKGTDISITPAVSNGTITPYTFTDVTVPIAASAQTVVTNVESSKKNVATVGNAVTVATGAANASGAGASIVTGVGTTTNFAVVGASLQSSTKENGGIYTGDDVTYGVTSVGVEVTGTAEAQTWTQQSGTISGTAAAQTWTQKSGTASVSGNVTVSGNVSLSGTSGEASQT